MKDQLLRIIDDTLIVELPLLEGYKPLYKTDKNNQMKYDGFPKLIDLEDWLSALVNRSADMPPVCLPTESAFQLSI